jgi:putative membrane protein
VGPAQTLRQFAVPLLVAVLGISGSQGGFEPWLAGPALALPVVVGLLPWLTTRYRLTATQFEQRSGLLNRQQLTAPLDRVRSVDLEASLLHRLLGLTKVQIGTGVDDTRIELNALSTTQAAELRQQLLARRNRATPQPGASVADAPQWADDPAAQGGLASPAARPSEPPRVLARIDWSWLRFAPFSLSRLVVVAGIIGALSQYADSLPFLDEQHLDSAWRWASAFALPLVILSITLSAVTTWLLIAVAGYVVQWWNLSLTREAGTLHLTAGLFTKRSVTVEEAKVRGVELTQPVLLRLVRGAELATLATGVGSGGTTSVLPPSPRQVCQSVGSDVLGSADALVPPLRRHGAAARRRRHLRAQWPALALVITVTTLALRFDWPRWLPLLALLAVPLAASVAEGAYRNLGHLLTRDHLAAGAPSVGVARTVLERDGVIGWVIQQSFFQRRRGLATLVATTAAGSERLVVVDVPLPRAVALAAAVTPEPVTPFLA